jgi:hypothetical protein
MEKKNGAIPINIPTIINNTNRNLCSSSVSYGLAFNYVYFNYIVKNENISVFIENDIFPFKTINIENYIENYEICGEVSS